MVLLTTVTVPMSLTYIPPPRSDAPLPESVLLEMVTSPPKFATAPPRVAEFSDILTLAMVNDPPVLRIPPPASASFWPLDMVRPEIVVLDATMSKMRNSPWVRTMVSLLAPGPLITRFLSISNWPLVS
jgi:hypothetical protein